MNVEKSIPVPRPGRCVFPFGDMAVGDSFVVEPSKIVSCRNSACGYALRHGVKFSVKKDDAGVMRCWRVA